MMLFEMILIKLTLRRKIAFEILSENNMLTMHVRYPQQGVKNAFKIHQVTRHSCPPP